MNSYQELREDPDQNQEPMMKRLTKSRILMIVCLQESQRHLLLHDNLGECPPGGFPDDRRVLQTPTELQGPLQVEIISTAEFDPMTVLSVSIEYRVTLRIGAVGSQRICLTL